MRWRRFGVGLCLALLAACGGAGRSTDSTDLDSEEQVVRVQFERSGGVAGIVRRVDLATDDLTEEAAAELQGLVSAADFFALPDQIAGDPVPDDFTYVINVETEDRSATVRTSDAHAPESLRPLIAWLNRALRGSGN